MSALFDWLGPAARDRAVLIVNHLLVAEPQASARLRPHAGRVIRLRVAGAQLVDRLPALAWAVTPAGLLEPVEASEGASGLEVVAELQRPVQALLGLLAGRRPPLRIEGDAAFAADVAWLIDHVRWEAEEDLARLVGDAPAHQAMRMMRRLRQALQPLLARLADAAGARDPGGMADAPTQASGGVSR